MNMDECEVCGRKTKELFLVDIEGAQMTVCRQCSKGKEVLQTYSEAEKEAPRQYQKEKEHDEVVENYGALIKSARERMGLPAKVLAERINEKESTLIRVEKEQMLPGDTLAKKLEKALGIKLVLKSSTDRQHYSASKQGPITMGDAAVFKKHGEQVD